MIRRDSSTPRAPQRPQFDNSPFGGWWDVASVSALVLFWAVGLRVITDFGATWDENFHITYGQAIFDYFESGGVNDFALTYRSNFLYGGAFDLLGTLMMDYGPWKTYHAWHLAVFFVAVFAYAGVWRLGRFMGGPAAGFFSLCTLLLHPVFIGHSFNNPKDLPFAAGYIWAVYGIIRVASDYPRTSKPRLVWLGGLIGLAMCVRIAGLLALGYCFAALAAALLVRSLAAPSARSHVANFQGLVTDFFTVMVTAWVTMIAAWPWALMDPIRRPFVVVQRMTYFAHHDRRMPFAGRTIKISDDTPEYLLHYFGLKTPEFIMTLCGVGAVIILVRLIRMRRMHAQTNIHSLSFALIWTSCLFPPIYAIAKGSHLYDGLRHFLFLLPVMAVITGMATSTILAAARSLRTRALRIITTSALSALLVAIGAWHTYWIARLHPHQSTYFNAASGGIEAAYENYDLDYYAASYNDASRLLQRRLWRKERTYYLNNPIIVRGCWLASAVAEYVPQNFVVSRPQRSRDPKPDFFLGYTRNKCHKRYKRKPLYGRVRRDDATITVIRDLRVNSKKNNKRKTKKAPKTKSKPKSATLPDIASRPPVQVKRVENAPTSSPTTPDRNLSRRAKPPVGTGQPTPTMPTISERDR
jgi:hypothetical protein